MKGDYHAAALQCIDACVGFTKAEIIGHCRWHADYMDLQVRNRCVGCMQMLHAWLQQLYRHWHADYMDLQARPILYC